MAKIDKSQYTKQQIQALLAEKRQQKELDKIKATSKSLTQVTEHTNHSYGFVLGNGTSRQSVDLDLLKPYGKIYGCNALYREFDPDYLIAVDVKMILEINNKKYQIKNPNVWTNPNKAYNKLEGFNYFRPSKGWSSGPTALWLASQHGYKTIYILGFDYKGLNDGKLVNNVYAGSPNYKKENDTATYYGNWLRQTKSVIQENKKINYVRVIAPDNYQPGELNNFSNFSTITLESFKRIFNL
jgi:hypothetical protein